jgi:hypothetical protein
VIALLLRGHCPPMHKAERFRQIAETCRQLARGHSRCTVDLLQMATIWELLAAEHEQNATMHQAITLPRQ